MAVATKCVLRDRIFDHLREWILGKNVKGRNERGKEIQ